MPSKSNYICVECRIEMRPLKNGAIVEELMDDGSPYKVWMCDFWQCPVCCTRMATGFPSSPVSEHFKQDYAKWAEQAAFQFGARSTAR